MASVTLSQHPGTLAESTASATPGKQLASTPNPALERPVAPHDQLRTVRNASLRRVKDSHEQLRARSARARGGSNVITDATANGRSFTVGNIKPNGIIYLRPTTGIRPGNQRTSAAPPLLHLSKVSESVPATDTSTSGNSSKIAKTSFLSDSPSPPPFVLSPPPPQVKKSTISNKPRSPTERTIRHKGHTRSQSQNALDDTPNASQEEQGTFKVVIDRPTSARRPNEPALLPISILKVPIPTYRLGTPRFSVRGTPTLRSSIYTRGSGTDEVASTIYSPVQPENETRLFLTPPGHLSFMSRRHSESFGYQPNRPAIMTRPSARTSQATVEAAIYDGITANPNDSSAVRLNSLGEIVAATPSRLVAHITSPDFLDYELLSDFFLTFRAFLSSTDLAEYLIARLQWAVYRKDEFGKIVRVRTFVAIRHWILNYFVDDFIPDFALRNYFCITVNHLYRNLKTRPDTSVGDSNIVGELKKCWKRTCAQFWEPDEAGNDNLDENITPGGWTSGSPSIQEAGSRSFDALVAHASTSDTSNMKEDAAAIQKHLEWVRQNGHAYQQSMATSLPFSQRPVEVLAPLSPVSEASLKVLSCSIPTKSRLAHGTTNLAMYPHPVPAPAPVPNATVANPKAPHQQHRHKRSGSFSDALRDARAPLTPPKALPKQTELDVIDYQPGSLVRGALYQPQSPYVELRVSYSLQRRSPLELNIPDLNIAYNTARLFPTSNQSVKRMIGSVRRALSSKSHPQHNGSIDSVLGQHMHTPPPSQPPSKANTEGSQTDGSETNLTKPPKSDQAKVQAVRIDLLAARIEESFKNAIAEEIVVENEGRNSLLVANLGGMEPTLRHSARLRGARRETKTTNHTRLQSGVTDGSRSIVIFDDTGAPPLPMMSGALPLEAARFVSASNGSRPPETMNSSEATVPGLASAVHEITTPSPIQASNNARPDLIAQSHQPADREELPQVIDVPLMRAASMSSAYFAHHEETPQRRGTVASTRTSASLRRYASYQSGMSRWPGSMSTNLRQISQAYTGSSDEDPFQYEDAPVHKLRRRPGGNLRAADNVNDLVKVPRRHSIGSMSVHTESIVTSSRGMRLTSGPITPDVAAISPMPGANDEDHGPPRRRISLIETHSSQPNMRPSFEAEVLKLAALPDFIEDDGGIEATLLKLEGRYEHRTPPRTSLEPEAQVVNLTLPLRDQDAQTLETRPQTPTLQTNTSATTETSAPHTPLQPSPGGQLYPGNMSIAMSEDSYNSVPLLERGFSSEIIPPARRHPGSKIDRSLLHPDSPRKMLDVSTSKQEHLASESSIEHIEKPESLNRVPLGAISPRLSISQSSFLLEDNQEFSEHSSDVLASFHDDSEDEIDNRVQSFRSDEPAFTDKYMVHPLRHPPTPPPATLDRTTVELASQSATSLDRPQFQKQLPTPGMTPPMKMPETTPPPMAAPVAVRPSIEHPPPSARSLPNTPQHSRDNSGSINTHLPYIMAYSSEKLAQQFTIIEKDALDEIDWKELIELRWKQSSPNIQDWVEYLRTQEPHGVDVVIARFNLMVKWALSEIVLTEDIQERARIIVKYLHIALHARALHNYATMYQITVALLSSDCARLTKTWEFVPATEKDNLKELESLVQPLRNFHSLRVEMETVTSEEGCIPFIGIYTRDLIYNAQKPAFIGEKPGDGGEHLVNFERHRTAATIVKSLLRLLEASSKYKFEADPVLISKCLWMASLSDDEISKASRRLE